MCVQRAQMCSNAKWRLHHRIIRRLALGERIISCGTCSQCARIAAMHICTNNACNAHVMHFRVHVHMPTECFTRSMQPLKRTHF